MDAPVHHLAVDRHPREALALSYRHADGREERFTFGDVADRSRALAARLAREGVRAGDRVVVLGAQAPETAFAHVALSRLAAISVPLSPLFGPDGLAPRVADAAPALALVDASRRAAFAEAAPGVRALDLSEAAGGGRAQTEDNSPRWAAQVGDPGPRERPFTIIYTSGTTGFPKGALLPHRVIEGRLAGFLAAHPGFPREGDLFWSPADWAWIGGLHDALLAPWALGGAVFAYERRGPFDPEVAVREIARAGVRNAFLPPTALKTLMRSGVDASRLSLRTLHTAGEPLAVIAHEWATRALGVAPREVYGLTECAFLVVNGDARAGVAGRPTPGFDVRVSEEGEIVARAGTPTMMLGYWAGAGKEPHLPLADGWLRTGDYASQDDEGWIRYQGRRDDLIKTSGYRVGPAEIEAELLRDPRVAECAVVGVPDEARGQAIHAFVKLVPGEAGDEALRAALQSRVRERLAAHEVPRKIAFVAELPMTTTGKIRRAALRP